MRDLDVHLRAMLRQIEPTPTQRAGAKRSHTHLRSILRTGEMGKRILDDYLSGSYRRKTAIHPLDDVDVIFIIDPQGWPGAMFGLSDKPNPTTVLKSFANALRYRYPQTSAYSQRRSIRLELHHLDIDCVPAIAIEKSDLIWVGDRREDVWVKSSPKRHEEAVTKVNQANDGLVIPVIKLLKRWNRGLPEGAMLRSFVVETIAVRLFREVACTTLTDGLLLYLDFVANFAGEAQFKWSKTYGIAMDLWNGMEVPDTAETGANVAAGVDSDRMKSFRREAVKSRDALLRAQGARSASSAQAFLSSALRWA